MRNSSTDLEGLVEQAANDFYKDAADSIIVDDAMARLSAAISLKRIADSLESILIQMQRQ